MHQQTNTNISNSLLLNILSRRSTQSFSKKNEDWPGKQRPGLANFMIRHNSLKSISKNDIKDQNPKFRCTSNTTKTFQLIKSVPLVKMSLASLSLEPNTRNKTILMESTVRTTHNTNFYTPQTTGRTFKPKPISLHISIAENNEIPSCQINANKRDLALEFVKKVEHESKLRKPKNVMSNYVVDYEAFNYIEKVIENPEKWEKFVHKKSKNGQFLTEVQQ